MTWSERFAQRIYDFLDIGKSPHVADCIVVTSSSTAVRSHAVKMWRFGYASQLVMGFTKAECCQFRELNLESDGGLEALAAQTSGKRQYFLVHLDRQEAHCAAFQPSFSGARSGAGFLAEFLRSMSVRSILVVSQPSHLRRMALMFRRAFRRGGVRLTFVAVPEKISFDLQSARAGVWSEFCRFLLCRFLYL